MSKLIHLMNEFGAQFYPKNKSNFPLTMISSEMPVAINYKSGVSAQLKSAVILAGLNNVRKILSTDVPGADTSAPPTPDAGTPAPQMMGGGALQLGNVQETQPIQAYVVTDELTDNQNKLAYIRRRATI